MNTNDKKTTFRGAKTKEDHVLISSKGGSAKTDKPKGLAAMSPERREEIRAKGLETRRKNKEQELHEQEMDKLEKGVAQG